MIIRVNNKKYILSSIIGAVNKTVFFSHKHHKHLKRNLSNLSTYDTRLKKMYKDI